MRHLDWFAMALTGTSTALLAFHQRVGFLFLLCGSVAWACVALRARLHGRPVWGQVIGSAWTFGWSVWGWWRWQ